MSIAEWWTSNVQPILAQPETAGTVGSVLSLRWAPGKTWGTKAFAVFSGAAVVVFVSPAAAQFFNVSSPRYLVLMGFFFGFGGPYILAALADFFRELRWREIVSIVLNLKNYGSKAPAPKKGE